MRKKSQEQKSYFESAGSIYAGFNSHRSLADQFYASEKSDEFKAIINFIDRATIRGINSKYSIGITSWRPTIGCPA